MKILFITAHRLGDAVISTAVLNLLQERYPRAVFTIVCGPAVESLFTAVPRCERVISLTKKRHNRHWLSLWRQSVGKCWFMVVDLRSSVVSWGLWARHRIIVRGGRRPGLKIAQHARALRCETPLMPRLWLRPEEKHAAQQLLQSSQLLLALAPTAGTPTKSWPARSFVQLAQRFMAEGFRPVIFYGPGEVEKHYASPIVQALPEALDMGGNRPLGEVACLLQRCQIFVGSDSGLMHLSAAAGVPTLGLFGPSFVSQYAPSGPYTQTLCAPGPEGQGRMEALSVDEVFKAAQSLHHMSTHREERKHAL
ncbi:glycosyltransferase family 9 protein [Saccharibacter sp. 17.LH.SD]|uniref:glycosyltransferase family 9 protein n=1 Tax=Saccharibacter sp. 17.LH.SD TaxID=2689393 RepID=UPI0013691473|nr:glycosyltransferase family 9 protein [Saccharibacter sp. 17.LH.SD]MXV44543.1 glycosyltransferase family 9 protein [Saccharibacter sp. 17.LH.SD]